ncbi:hypothetical protein GCM10023116_35660 [Kistimonas scapharcae]|uniref:Uncharacterized protein n=1 Tax=Kistimonas scapharcae TaxID=1036133 RepID=A0ABP8V5X3_9GAMM
MAQPGSLNVHQNAGNVGVDRRPSQEARELALWHRVLRVVVPVLSVTSMLVGGLVCIAMPIIGGVVAGLGVVSLGCYVVGKCIYDRLIRAVPPTQTLHGVRPAASETTLLLADTESVHCEDTEEASAFSFGSEGEYTPLRWGQPEEDRSVDDYQKLNPAYLPVYQGDGNIVIVEPDNLARESQPHIPSIDAVPGCSHWQDGFPLVLQGPDDSGGDTNESMGEVWEDIEIYDYDYDYEPFTSLDNYRQSLVKRSYDSRQDEDGYLKPVTSRPDLAMDEGEYLEPVSKGQGGIAPERSFDSLSTQYTDYTSIDFDQLSPEECVNKADSLLGIVNALIEDIPTKMVPFADYQRADELLDEVTAEFDRLKTSFRSTEDDLAKKMVEIKKHLNGLRCHVRDARGNDYRHHENYEKLINRFYEVAKITLKDNEENLNNLEEKYKDYKELSDIAGNGFLLDATAYVMRFEEVVQNLVKNAGLNEKYEEGLIRRLSDDTVAFTVQQTLLDKKGEWRTVEHVYTPAHQVRFQLMDEAEDDPKDGVDPFEESYERKGSPSLYRNTQHAVSMYHYKMKIDGDVVEQYTRVGTPYASKELTGENVERVTRKRLREIVVNILVNEMADELDKAIKDGSYVVNLKACYLNLMSPDRIRGMLGALPLPKKVKDVLDDEAKWVKYLADEYIGHLDQILDGGEITVKTAKGEIHRVKLNLNAVMFILPCNQLALSGFWSCVGKTWKIVKQVNLRALNTLKQKGGIVDETYEEIKKKDPGNADAWKKKIDKMIDELYKKIEKAGSKASIDDIARLQEDIDEILEELGMHKFTGCKSNKDRTSIMMAKKQASHFDQRMCKNFMLHGGHLQIQINNTGVPGGKYDRYMLEGNKDISHAVARTKKTHRKSKKRKGVLAFNVRNPLKKYNPKKITSGKKGGEPESHNSIVPPVPKRPSGGLVPGGMISALQNDGGLSSDDGGSGVAEQPVYEDIDELRSKHEAVVKLPEKKKGRWRLRRR